MSFVAVNLISLGFWFVYLRTKKPEWVDVGWGVFLLSSFALHTVPQLGSDYFWFVALISFWWIRLSWHVILRIRSGHIDERYKALQAVWSKNFDFKLLGFYLLQSSGAFLLTLPLSVLASHEFGTRELLLTMLLVVSIAGEFIADLQLKNFLHAKSGRVCQNGLWRYSRHPNYFFELCSWFILVLFCIALPWGWTAILSFALMVFLIFRVTGIPPIEKRARRTKGEEWAEYERKTSVLVPWLVKK